MALEELKISTDKKSMEEKQIRIPKNRGLPISGGATWHPAHWASGGDSRTQAEHAHVAETEPIAHVAAMTSSTLL